VRGALSVRCAFDLCELGGEEDDLAEWLSDGRFELIRLLLGLLFCWRFVLCARCEFEVRELGGGEDDLAEWLSAGRFEVVRLLLGGRFAVGGRSDALLLDVLFLDVLFLLDDVAGREAAFEPVDAVGRF